MGGAEESNGILLLGFIRAHPRSGKVDTKEGPIDWKIAASRLLLIFLSPISFFPPSFLFLSLPAFFFFFASDTDLSDQNDENVPCFRLNNRS